MKEIISWISKETNSVDEKCLCPILGSPNLQCYCKNINHNNILLVMRFCLGDFRYCSIYKRIQKNSTLDHSTEG